MVATYGQILCRLQQTSFGHNNTSCTIRHCLLMSIVQEVFAFVIEPVVQSVLEFNSQRMYFKFI